MTTRKFNLLFLLLGVLVTSTAHPQTAARTVMVRSNNAAIIYPTNFWSANAAQARSGLGLGSAATNPASAFQPSSAVLSNLATGQGLGSTNITGTLSIVSGGTGATNSATARTNIGLGWGALTNTNAANFRSNIDLGNESSVAFSNLSLFSGALTNPAIALGSKNRGFYATVGPERITTTVGGVAALSVFSSSVETGSGVGLSSGGNLVVSSNFSLGGPISFIGIGASASIATTRTNLGLGWSALTNSNTATALVGYNTNNGNVVMPSSLTFSNNVSFSQNMSATTNSVNAGGTLFAGSGSKISFYNTEDQSRWRTNLGLGWSALTNTNVANFKTAIGLEEITSSNGVFRISTVGTERFSVDAGGNVRIQTGQFILSGNSSAISFATNNTSGAATTRTNLGLGATWLTNTNVTNFRTAIELGATNSPRFASVTIGAPDQDDIGISASGITTGSGGISLDPQQLNNNWAVSGSFSWTSNSFAATTRTNLGLGATWLTNVSISGFREALELGTNNAYFERIYMFTANRSSIVPPPVPIGDPQQVIFYARGEGNDIVLNAAASASDTYTVAFEERLGSWAKTTNSSTARTNLGLGATWLTNTNVTNFQSAIFDTNSAPTNTTTVAAWTTLQIGTNAYRVPLYR